MKALLQMSLCSLFLLLCNGCEREPVSRSTKFAKEKGHITRHTLSVPLVRDGTIWRTKDITVSVIHDTSEHYSDEEATRLLSRYACINGWIVAEYFTRHRYGSIHFAKDEARHTAKFEIPLSELLPAHHAKME